MPYVSQTLQMTFREHRFPLEGKAVPALLSRYYARFFCMNLKTLKESPPRDTSHLGGVLSRNFRGIHPSSRIVSLLLFCAFSLQSYLLQAETPPAALQSARKAVVSLYIMKPTGCRDICKNLPGEAPSPTISLTLPQQEKQLSWGSGVVLTKEGLIITSYHVVCGAQKIEVVFFDGKKELGKVLKVDPQRDLAALMIAASGPQLDFPTLSLGDDTTLEAGEDVFAIGNILGLPQSVGKGVISETNRKLHTSPYPLIQTDVAMGPGSSGGALLNKDAELIGLTTAIFSEKNYRFGVGFAVGVRFIKQFLESIES